MQGRKSGLGAARRHGRAARHTQQTRPQQSEGADGPPATAHFGWHPSHQRRRRRPPCLTARADSSPYQRVRELQRPKRRSSRTNRSQPRFTRFEISRSPDPRLQILHHEVVATSAVTDLQNSSDLVAHFTHSTVTMIPEADNVGHLRYLRRSGRLGRDAALLSVRLSSPKSRGVRLERLTYAKIRPSRHAADRSIRKATRGMDRSGWSAVCRRLRLEWVFRPGVFGIAAPQIFSDLVIGRRPEAAQVAGDLDGPVIRSEYMEQYGHAAASQARRFGPAEQLLEPDGQDRRAVRFVNQVGVAAAGNGQSLGCASRSSRTNEGSSRL